MPIAFFPKAIYFIISINIHHYQSQLGVMLKSQKCLGDYFILIKPYIWTLYLSVISSFM